MTLTAPETSKRKILEVLKIGGKHTSYELNKAGNTVDARKYISELRQAGHLIKDEWHSNDRIRFKKYFITPK